MNKPVFEMTLIERLRHPEYMKHNWDMAGFDAAKRIEELEEMLKPSSLNIVRSICAHCDYVLPGDEPYLLREHSKTCPKSPMRTAEKRIEDLEAALKEISLGRGPFSNDLFEHAKNTIEAMKEVAKAALEGREWDI